MDGTLCPRPRGRARLSRRAEGWCDLVGGPLRLPGEPVPRVSGTTCSSGVAPPPPESRPVTTRSPPTREGGLRLRGSSRVQVVGAQRVARVSLRFRNVVDEADSGQDQIPFGHRFERLFRAPLGGEATWLILDPRLARAWSERMTARQPNRGWDWTSLAIGWSRPLWPRMSASQIPRVGSAAQ